MMSSPLISWLRILSEEPNGLLVPFSHLLTDAFVLPQMSASSDCVKFFFVR